MDTDRPPPAPAQFSNDQFSLLFARFDGLEKNIDTNNERIQRTEERVDDLSRRLAALEGSPSGSTNRRCFSLDGSAPLGAAESQSSQSCADAARRGGSQPPQSRGNTQRAPRAQSAGPDTADPKRMWIGSFPVDLARPSLDKFADEFVVKMLQESHTGLYRVQTRNFTRHIQLVCETQQGATDILEALRLTRMVFEGTEIRSRRDRTSMQRVAGVVLGDMFANVTKALAGTPHMEGNSLLADPVSGCLWISSGDRAKKLFGVEVASSGAVRISPEADMLAKVGLTQNVAAMVASATEAGRARL